MNRGVSIKYVVYELNNVMGSERHQALERVSFNDWVHNSFNTEEEAVKALVKDNRTYESFFNIKNSKNRMTNREKAIEWWNNLNFEEQVKLKNKYIGLWYPMSMVTGISIEIIYEELHEGN